MLCDIAGISREAYYKYLRNKDKETLNNQILEVIRSVQKETSYAIGHRPMKEVVNEVLNIKVGEGRILRIMKGNNLLSHVRVKKWTPSQYKRRKEMKVGKPKDLLKQNFFCGTPRKRFVVDITYLYCLEKMYYLNTIMDLFNREIVAWRISDSPNGELCVNTLLDLSSKYDLDRCIIHSDAGTSYVNNSYMDLMEKLNVRMSVSVGNCYDNAAEESLNSIIKTEAFYTEFGKKNFKNRQVKAELVLAKILWFIPWYNSVRKKKGFNWQTPIERLEKNPKGTLPIIYNPELTL